MPDVIVFFFLKKVCFRIASERAHAHATSNEGSAFWA
jgi:hypothetical protein